MGIAVGVGSGLCPKKGVGTGVLVGVGIGELVGVGTGVAVGVGVGVGWAVGVGIGVAVGAGVGVAVGDGSSVAVGSGAAVGSAVLIAVSGEVDSGTSVGRGSTVGCWLVEIGDSVVTGGGGGRGYGGSGLPRVRAGHQGQEGEDHCCKPGLWAYWVSSPAPVAFPCYFVQALLDEMLLVVAAGLAGNEYHFGPVAVSSFAG